MSDYDYNDEERNAYIDKQFEEIYRFCRDLIDDPWVLSVIPDGSELRHRTIQFDDRRVQLTAHRPSESDEIWTALVTSWDSRGSIDEDKLRIESGRPAPAPAPTAVPPFEVDEEFVQTAETADAALDALERRIRERSVLVASKAS